MQIAMHAALLLATIFALYPVLWVVSLALSSHHVPEPSALPLPVAPSLDNMRGVMGTGSFGRQLANSLIVSLATAGVGCALAIPAGYALARFDFLGKKGGTALLMATQMFPTVASAIPLYLLLDALHLLDTRTGLVVCYASTSVPFAVFQLRGAFETIPKDLEEAAMIDGATRFVAFVRVVLPAARPAIAVTFLFAFMSAWNEFILAATILGREEAFTLPVVLSRYVGEHDADWGRFAAGALIVSVPVMALFYFTQRHLVGGLTAGGVKGLVRRAPQSVVRRFPRGALGWSFDDDEITARVERVKRGIEAGGVRRGLGRERGVASPEAEQDCSKPAISSVVERREHGGGVDHDDLRARRVMPMCEPRRSHRARRRCFVRHGHDAGDRVAPDRPRAEHAREVARDVDDGRFETDVAGAAIEDDRDAISERTDDVLGQRRRHLGGSIRARGGDRTPDRGEQRASDRVRRNAQRDGVATRGHDVRNARRARHHQRQRTGPERGGERLGSRRKRRRERTRRRDVEHVHDQRVVLGAALGDEDLRRRRRVERQRAQAIDRLGGKRDQLTGEQRIGGAPDHDRIRRLSIEREDRRVRHVMSRNRRSGSCR